MHVGNAHRHKNFKDTGQHWVYKIFLDKGEKGGTMGHYISEVKIGDL